MRSENRVSCGGVVFKRTPAGIKLLLNARAGRTVWCLPKGHQEPGETFEQTALREVREETGLRGRILKEIGRIRYTYTEDRVRITKTVIFYLMRYLSGSTRNHDFEVDAAKWFSAAEALPRMTHAQERQIVRKGLKLIPTAL